MCRYLRSADWCVRDFEEALIVEVDVVAAREHGFRQTAQTPVRRKLAGWPSRNGGGEVRPGQAQAEGDGLRRLDFAAKLELGPQRKNVSCKDTLS